MNNSNTIGRLIFPALPLPDNEKTPDEVEENARAVYVDIELPDGLGLSPQNQYGFDTDAPLIEGVVRRRLCSCHTTTNTAL